MRFGFAKSSSFRCKALSLRAFLFALPFCFVISCLPDKPSGSQRNLKPGYSTEYPIELLKMDVAAVVSNDVSSSIPVIGSIISSNQVDVSTDLAGTLSKVHFKKGDFVRKGVLLASLNKEVLSYKKDQARSQYDVGVVQLSLARKDFSNSSKLHQKGFLSDLAFETAEATVKQREAQLSLYKAQYEEISDQLNNTDVYSPMDGYIAESYVNSGQSVAPGQRLFSIVDLDHLEASLLVPAEKVLHVHIKTPSELFISDQKSPIHSEISRISPKSDADTHTFIVFSPIPNDNGLFRAGMFVKGFIITDTHKHVLTVPEIAIHDEANKKFVYSINNNKILKQYVDIGLYDKIKGYFEISSGLKKGDIIVVKDFGSLAQGTYVKITDVTNEI